MNMKLRPFFGYGTLLALIQAGHRRARVAGVETEGRILKATSRIGGKSLFLEGSLGQLNLNAQGIVGPDLREEGKKVLEEIIEEILGGTGDEVVQAAPEKIHREKSGSYHIRYHHYIDGLMVEGASMMLHVDGSNGTVTAVNGEFAPTKEQDQVGRGLQDLSCEQAIQAAIQQLDIPGAVRDSDCELSAVYADDGYFQKAWKAFVAYEVDNEPNQRDEVFVSLDTGRLLARFPTIHGGLALGTYDCSWSKTNCALFDSSPGYILPVDSNALSQAVADAHNYAIDTYNYFYGNFRRDSIDNRGMKLISRVNYADPGKSFLNAFWNGRNMTYGTGDGATYYPFSRGCDVVAHEIMHGVTQHTSGLRYANESGALNEAMSDIFGAVVERASRGKSITDTFLIGEDLFRRGGFFRNMANPAERRHNDHYSKLYVGKYLSLTKLHYSL
jgi:Zn-dependent metalloprotease